MKYITILSFALFLYSCTNDIPHKKEIALENKQTTSIELKKLFSKNFVDEPSINDIPLMTNQVKANERHSELTKRLHKLGLLEDATDGKAMAVTNKEEINNRLKKAIQQNRISATDLEYESVIILKNMKLLKDSTPEALTAIRFHLDNLLKVNSKNTILYYYCLNAIKPTLNQEEVNNYAKKILTEASNNKSYANAVLIKAKMIKILTEKPEYFKKLANNVTFLITIKALNSQILEEQYYLKAIKNLNKVE